MLPATAQQLVEHLSENHVEWFKENPHGTLGQMLLVERGDGNVEIGPCGWADPHERQIMLAFLRHHMEEIKAVRYALWCEAWIKMVRKPIDTDPAQAVKELMDAYKQGDISTDPERKEVVFTLVVEPGGRQTSLMQTIERGPDGAVTGLTPWEDGAELVNLGGALADLLPFHTVH
jgi:hypothetical protein